MSSAADALRVVLARELSKRQALAPRRIAGRELVKIANAVCSREALRADLGLDGELQALLLRWGHDAKFTQMALTCCPERLEILRRCDPEVLAAHIERAGRLPPVPGEPPLLSVLRSGDLLKHVTPEWLKRNMPGDYWLARSLDCGGHYASVTPTWIVQNMHTDIARAYALRAGHYLKRKDVTRAWLNSRIGDRRVLLACLQELDDHCDVVFLRSAFPKFEDFMDGYLIWHHRDASLERVYEYYDAWFRNHEMPPNDLAAEIIKFNADWYEDAVILDVCDIARRLQGVSVDVFLDVLDTVDALSGIDDLICNHFGGVSLMSDVAKALQSLGWNEEESCAIARAVERISA